MRELVIQLRQAVNKLDDALTLQTSKPMLKPISVDDYEL